MKGRNSFSSVETQIIKKLISEKILSPAEKQKVIRSNIRKMGFYYSDFEPDKKKYTVADFERLIKLGLIKIIDKIQTRPLSRTDSRPHAEKPSHKSLVGGETSQVLELILDKFKLNRFHPNEHSETAIHNSSGNYIICLRKGSSLPTTTIKPILTDFEGLQVIYTGIAGTSLRVRDFKQHFIGNNAGRSTLRKSLGALFGFKFMPRDSDPSNGKTKFSETDEIKLSKWMREHLIMFFLSSSEFNTFEDKLIRHFNPPLNIKGNMSSVNADFRRMLSRWRNSKA